MLQRPDSLCSVYPAICGDTYTIILTFFCYFFYSWDILFRDFILIHIYLFYFLVTKIWLSAVSSCLLSHTPWRRPFDALSTLQTIFLYLVRHIYRYVHFRRISVMLLLTLKQGFCYSAPDFSSSSIVFANKIDFYSLSD